MSQENVEIVRKAFEALAARFFFFFFFFFLGRDAGDDASAVLAVRRGCGCGAGFSVGRADFGGAGRHGRQADEVPRALAVPRRRHRRRHADRRQSPVRPPKRRSVGSSIPTLPPTPLWAYDDGSGLAGQAGSFGMAVVAQSGTPLTCSYTHPLPADVSCLDSRGHAADASRQPGAAYDASPRRLRRGRQRRQSCGDAERVRPRRDADRFLHQPAAADAGVAARGSTITVWARRV